MHVYRIRAVFTGFKEEYIYDSFVELIENLRSPPVNTNMEWSNYGGFPKGYVELETTDELDAVTMMLSINNSKSMD